jgi:hypothetical protein
MPKQLAEQGEAIEVGGGDGGQGREGNGGAGTRSGGGSRSGGVGFRGGGAGFRSFGGGVTGGWWFQGGKQGQCLGLGGELSGSAQQALGGGLMAINAAELLNQVMADQAGGQGLGVGEQLQQRFPGEAVGAGLSGHGGLGPGEGQQGLQIEKQAPPTGL